MNTTDASARLAALAERVWQDGLEEHPEQATHTGDRRNEDRMTDIGPEGRARRLEKVRRFREEAAAMPEGELEKTDRVTRALLLKTFDEAIEGERHRLHQLDISLLWGPHQRLPDLMVTHPFDDVDGHRHWIDRCGAFSRYLEQYAANLREGLAAGRPMPRLILERVLAAVRREVEAGPEGCSCTMVLNRIPEGPEKAELAEAHLGAIREDVLPALDRFATFLVTEYLPQARDSVGLCGLPDGPEVYAFRIRRTLGKDWDPEALHRIGMEEIELIHEEMQTIAWDAGHGENLDAYREALAADPAEHFDSREALLEAARKIVADTYAWLPDCFGVLPKSPCEVRAVEKYREAEAVAAFYMGPDHAGTRPGIYYINTSTHEMRLRYNLQALSFHEAVPGHHFQIARARELEGLPTFRRHAGDTAFVEGWALYTERLADELGKYDGPASRYGMLTYQAWRAARLVVDTGLHAMGWTRQEALDFMRSRLALPEGEILNEVDRYICWPSQALAYKVGQREIARLRGEARDALGGRFDLASFHDEILAHGGIPLSVLETVVSDWVLDAGAASFGRVARSERGQ